MFLGKHDVSFHFLQILHCVTLIINSLPLLAVFDERGVLDVAVDKNSPVPVFDATESEGPLTFAGFGIQLDPVNIEARANTSTELNL
jgi:hypothetical protein